MVQNSEGFFAEAQNDLAKETEVGEQKGNRNGKIGFVGFGIMGKPVALNIIRAGYDLTFYARRQDVIDEVSAAGGHSVDSSKAVAEAADIIATCVTAD
ncbi:uncharacterized protein METZ01_LOCUS354884, partial [marine metagenome]